MTVDERTAHQYKPGDRAVIQENFPWTFDSPRPGDVIEITALDVNRDVVLYLWKGQEKRVHKVYLEPAGVTTTGTHACNCSLSALMSSGCTCGGR